MKKAVVMALTVLFALGLAGPVLAKGFGGRALCGELPGKGPVDIAEVIAGLGLSDDQAAKIQALQQDAYEKLQSLRETMWKKRQELMTLLWQKSPDKNAISAKWQELRQLRQQMNDVIQELRDQMRSILSEEQLRKLQQGRPCGKGQRGPNRACRRARGGPGGSF